MVRCSAPQQLRQVDTRLDHLAAPWPDCAWRLN
jgi:hypothetical protein